jgi:hypothetical protein
MGYAYGRHFRGACVRRVGMHSDSGGCSVPPPPRLHPGERLDMKRHLQRIGAEGQHGSIFEPTARS